ncbi:MAG: tetratricopeptide repeat protein [Candidatus Tectomicrobia bacterium]|nr:tetratricopeptide repeat protein [Candidatus Tectomicrobia bacterium]
MNKSRSVQSIAECHNDMPGCPCVVGMTGRLPLCLLTIFAVIYLLLAFPALSLADPLSLGEESLDMWKAEKAVSYAREILSQNRQSVPALSLMGRALFYGGDYGEAIEYLEKARSYDQKNERVQGYLQFVRQTYDVVKQFQTFESQHFLLKLDESKDGILADYALNTMEKAYEVMGHDFNFFPQEKIRIEIFPDSQSFYYASSLSKRDIEVSGAIGICKFNKIMIISPRALIQGYRWLDSLAHEYVHFAIVHLTKNRAPIWLHEGIAKYQEARWRQQSSNYLNPVNESLLANALKTDNFVTFEEMHPSLVKLDTTHKVRLAYAETASAIDFIIRLKGYEGIRKIFEVMTQFEEQSTEKAIAEVMGISLKGFEVKWKEHLKTQKLQEVDGIQIEQYRVKDSSRIDEERMALDEIKSVVARRHALLGDMLRERGRHEAATIEYKRALGKSPYSPSILNKLAKSLIPTNQEEALSHLLKAKQLYPDHVTTYTNLGYLYIQMRQYDEAEKAFDQSAQINPFDPFVHRQLAGLYERRGDLENASREEKMSRKLVSTN